MFQRSNPASNIFQDAPLEFKGNSSSFICSTNLAWFGIYEIKKSAQLTQSRKSTQVLNGEIIVFLLKEGKWIEQLKKKIQSNKNIELLCFNKNGKQLLFYESVTNCIECLNMNQINEKHTSINGTIKCFFQFQQNMGTVQMIPSNDSKIILIQADQKNYLLFNVISLMIISKFKSDLQQISFLDSTYLIQISHPIANNGGNLKFYDIQNMRVKKFLKRKRQQSSLFYQLNNCKSLAFTTESYIYAAIFNMVNVKIVRNIIINCEFENSAFFLGYTQRYLMHQLYSEKNQVRLCIIDLYNFDTAISMMKQYCSFQNQILKLTDGKELFNQFWLPK